MTVIHCLVYTTGVHFRSPDNKQNKIMPVLQTICNPPIPVDDVSVGVNGQLSNSLKFNRQTVKKAAFKVAVKHFQGLSNINISTAHLGLLALKESFNIGN